MRFDIFGELLRVIGFMRTQPALLVRSLIVVSLALIVAQFLLPLEEAGGLIGAAAAVLGMLCMVPYMMCGINWFRAYLGSHHDYPVADIVPLDRAAAGALWWSALFCLAVVVALILGAGVIFGVMLLMGAVLGDNIPALYVAGAMATTAVFIPLFGYVSRFYMLVPARTVEQKISLGQSWHAMRGMTGTLGLLGLLAFVPVFIMELARMIKHYPTAEALAAPVTFADVMAQLPLSMLVNVASITIYIISIGMVAAIYAQARNEGRL